jgi:excisionase family DNA binding protein
VLVIAYRWIKLNDGLKGGAQVRRPRARTNDCQESEVELNKRSKETIRSVAPEELTIEETAEVLHVSPAYVKNLIAEGCLTGARFIEGSRCRIRRASVLALKKRMKRAQREGLDQMVAASEQIGLYEAELKEIRIGRRQ